MLTGANDREWDKNYVRLLIFHRRNNPRSHTLTHTDFKIFISMEF